MIDTTAASGWEATSKRVVVHYSEPASQVIEGEPALSTAVFRRRRLDVVD